MRELLGALYIYFLNPILSLLLIILLVYVVLSWLVVGGVVSRYNPTTQSIMRFLDAILRPLLRPIQKVIPSVGGLDFSVFILGLVVVFLRDYAIPRLISLVPI
ncbi:MAG TPA: YggT family protein [Hyphomonadaceae bacterium]|nr:YggT family protein [Hyphomonadaceae bacterium]